MNVYIHVYVQRLMNAEMIISNLTLLRVVRVIKLIPTEWQMTALNKLELHLPRLLAALAC